MNGHTRTHKPGGAFDTDPFLKGYNQTELRIASEFLSNWLPFLSKDLCQNCTKSISDRIRSIYPIDGDADLLKKEEEYKVLTPDTRDLNECSCSTDNCDTHSLGSWKDGADIEETEDADSLGSWKDGANGVSRPVEDGSTSETVFSPKSVSVKSPKARMSWADMAQEDELEAEEEKEAIGEVKGTEGVKVTRKLELSREQREHIRFNSVRRKKDFICLERINGKIVNILDGLELHTGVFSIAEQKRIVDLVYELQEMGKNGELKERTYTAPHKWMRGKGRVTLQFGCCYNYATDKNGNPPGILQNCMVDAIPHLLKVCIRRLVRWHVLPPTCVPDSCIINIYDDEDCIPPHIDNHDFLRPFCTVSFLSECSILFGSNLKVEGPGEFSGAIAIPLPVGSVLVFNGNGADVAKHCVPAVPTKRISITFRKMEESKWPISFVPESDLQRLEPLVYEDDKSKAHPSKPKHPLNRETVRRIDLTDSSRGLLGRQPRSFDRSGPGSAPASRRRVRLEY